ncbi:UNVERIFIED_CONTAM: hypothetical protein PYX00_006721 [Menopon gallinae]|uniref:Macro domain-containing protein n=1 Tax=Menopon gallinae TaxID=328185 RepID=A0AAW2HW29_9NEOP
MDATPAFLKEKEKFLNMPQEERRKRYKPDVLNIDQVKTWSVYFKDNYDRLRRLDKNLYASRFSITPAKKEPGLNDIVSMWKGDITKLEVDAIVNAANSTLLGGLGVDGAIHRSAGTFLLEECKTLQGCDTGDAKITGGYELPAKYVIHTVGPKGEKANLLESCYRTSLEKLTENNLRTIAFPCVSTGVYGYPQDSAASVALNTVRKFLDSNSSKVDRIIFCLFLEKDVEIYETMLQLYFPAE